MYVVVQYCNSSYIAKNIFVLYSICHIAIPVGFVGGCPWLCTRVTVAWGTGTAPHRRNNACVCTGTRVHIIHKCTRVLEYVCLYLLSTRVPVPGNVEMYQVPVPASRFLTRV